ncbi:hypothetical protein O181_083388 [Austropuccinia psidii MF-1]|uniref:Uncharacterized protein n=1 Tax=Austropuccinia psidii MF-1 TaxID=1389203 RepID=A0A9Q3FTK4_9BASI|nr:hypothetical protein [Austropuccinia psidii MF-1]
MIKIQEPCRPWEIVHMDWVTCLPPGDDRSYHYFLAISDRFTYKTSINASTNQTPAILEKGCNPRLPQDSLRKDLVEIHPKAASFKGILVKARKHVVRFMEYSFAYSKEKWNKSHATPDFKVGDLLLVFATSFDKIKGCKELKDPISGPFIIKALHGENSFEVEFSEEIRNEHPKFPVSLIKPYKSGDYEKISPAYRTC